MAKYLVLCLLLTTIAPVPVRGAGSGADVAAPLVKVGLAPDGSDSASVAATDAAPDQINPRARVSFTGEP